MFDVIVTGTNIIVNRLMSQKVSQKNITNKFFVVIINGTDGTNKFEIGINDGTNNGTNPAPTEQCGTMSGTIRNNEESIDNIQDLVLNQIRKDKRISIKQLSKMFNKTRAYMFRIIEKLKAEGKLRRVGSLKSGTWEVIE